MAEKSEPATKSGHEIEVVRYEVGTTDYRDVATYDERRYAGPANAYKQTVMANAYKKLLGSLAGKRVLDMGCGTGRGVIGLADRCDFAIGCDASEDMLRFAAGKANGRANCAFVRSYAQFLPFAENTFDVVISLNFLHLFSLETQLAMVGEMKRVVRPGGHLVLEFDNALHGGIVGLYKRWFRDERGAFPWEVRFVIGDDCRVERIYGAVFPVVWRLLYRIPRFAIPFEKLGCSWPLNYFTHRVYYKLAK